MKLSELAAKLGVAAKTEQDIVAALDSTIAMANEGRKVMTLMRGTIAKAPSRKDKPEATCDEVLAFVNEAIVPHAGMEGTEIGKLQKELANCLAGQGTKANEITTLKTALANERKARTDLVIANALDRGTITKAEEANWRTQFANEETFDATLTEFSKLTPKLPTTSHLPNGGARHSDSGDLQRKITTLVNEVMDKSGLNYDAAFGTVKRDHPELFAGMVNPSESQAEQFRAKK